MKDFHWPLSTLEVTGVVVFVVFIVIANAGGLGGGGSFTPFMMIFFGLSIFECVPLANLFSLISALTRFIINYRQKHPNPEKAKDGKLSIDYEVVMLTMPMLYFGTLIGVQIGTVTGEWILAVSLASVLAFVAYKTVNKAIDLRV